MRILDHFERLYVISLPCKTDRRCRIEENLATLGLADRNEITWVRGISGDFCPPPLWFEAGGGAWGCLRSHIRIMEDAIMDGLASYCVLEDDAVFCDRAAEMLTSFMALIPDDWAQAYLGGQHWIAPEPAPESSGVLTCRGVCRTHAFAVHRRGYNRIYQHLNDPSEYIRRGAWHIDHHLCLAHEQRLWQAYAPIGWIAGQEAGVSNISGMNNPQYWWHPGLHRDSLPFVFLTADSSPGCDPTLDRFVHFGENRKSGSREDVGLDDCVGSRERLSEWMRLIAGEALERGRLPGIFHCEIPMSDVESCWGGPVVSFGTEDLVALADRAYRFDDILRPAADLAVRDVPAGAGAS